MSVIRSVPAYRPAYTTSNTLESLALNYPLPFNWVSGSVLSVIENPSTGLLDVSPATIRQVARFARDGGIAYPGTTFRAGAPSALDWETEYRDGTRTKQQVAAKLVEHCQTFRDEAPGVPLTLYGYGFAPDLYNYVHWENPWPEMITAMNVEARKFKPVIDLLDYVSVDCYIIQDVSVDRDLKAFANMADWARDYYDKPCIGWLWAQYNWTPYPFLSREVCSRYVSEMRRAMDAILIWRDEAGITESQALFDAIPPLVTR